MASVPIKYLDDITECPICTNNFTDPRELPCVHTFCLRCIEGWAAQRKSQLEQKMTCPLCRKETPLSGDQTVTQLPKNLFVERLLEVKKLSSRTSDDNVLCDICHREKSAGSGSAVVYCADCRQNICKECSVMHKNIRVLASHRLIELDGAMKAGDLLVKIGVHMCEKHTEKPLDVFCSECQLVMCMMCYIKEHKSHACSDVTDAADGLKKEMEKCMENVSKKDVEWNKLKLVLAEKESIFLMEVSKVEKEIEERAEDMKRAIDDHKRQLLDKLQTVKKREQKEIESVRQELDSQLMMMESWRKYSDQLREKGSACDIAREAGRLCVRAKELLDMGSIEKHDIMSWTCTGVSFKSLFTVDGYSLKKLLGVLNLSDDNFLSCTKPLKVLPSTGNCVTGLATLNDELFVARFGVKHVDVYCIETLNLTRQLQLSAAATGSSRGLTICPIVKYAFVSDCNAGLLHKVDVDAKIQTFHWSTGGSPCGVSLNKTQNGNTILVACQSADNIQEFTTNGVLVREISLGPNITGPVHVVQLADDRLGVVHRWNYNRYCEVDSGGNIIRSFDSGSGDQHLKNPTCSDLDKNGFSIITDSSNNQLILLDPNNFSIKQLSVEDGLAGPYTVHVDNSGDRLYVGEWSSSNRVIVLGIK